MRIQPWHVLPVLAFVAWASPASAQLNRAYEESWRPLQDMTTRLREFADNAAKRVEYDNLRSLARSYKETLDRFSSAVDAIGRNFRDSDNASWASRVKSPVLDYARRARDRADAVERKADAKSDAGSEIRDLQAALTDLSDRFREAWRQHEDKRTGLSTDFGTARERWWNDTKDDRRGIDEAVKRWSAAQERLDAVSVRRAQARQTFMRATEDYDRARSGYFGRPDQNRDEARGGFDTWKRAAATQHTAMTSIVALENELTEASRAVTAAYAECQRLWDAYVREVDTGDVFYAAEVQVRHERMLEFAAEYRPFSM